jgi:YfiR/HmsC-like
MNLKKISYLNMRLLFFILCFFIPQLVQAQFTEIEMKAVYLEKFTLFIDWPAESSLADSTKPFVIGVFKDKAFSKVLKNIYKERTIKNRIVQIKYFSDLNSIQDCNILFISGSKHGKVAKILSRIEGKPILTISDAEGFAEKGIHIDFFLESDKLKFEINQETLRKSGLKASYQLLQLARIVTSPGSNK